MKMTEVPPSFFESRVKAHVFKGFEVKLQDFADIVKHDITHVQAGAWHRYDSDDCLEFQPLPARKQGARIPDRISVWVNVLL
jgi:hypothetical protein